MGFGVWGLGKALNHDGGYKTRRFRFSKVALSLCPYLSFSFLYISTSRLRKRIPPGPYRTPVPRVEEGILGAQEFSHGRGTPVRVEALEDVPLRLA